MATDLRYALRTLRNNPGFAAVSIATLALGIGANTTVFSVMNATLFRPLPFADPGRLALVWWTNIHDATDHNIVDVPDYWDWQRQNHVFESMALFDSAGRGYNLSGDKQPELVPGLRITANFFHVLGATPYLGRTFTPEEETLGKNREVILSYGLWTRRYGADRSLLGRTVRIDGDSYTVVGVMPREFEFQWGGARELWVPVGYTKGDLTRGSHSFFVCARLKPGVTLGQAGAEMDTIGRRLSQQYSQDNAGMTSTVSLMEKEGVEGLQPMLLTLLGAVGFVLLIACVNVANLMMARGATREKELAIRRALGAGRLRVARQLLTESVLLAVLGAVSGLLLAAWSIALLPHVVPGNMLTMPFRRAGGIEMDGRVFVFTLLVACLTGILFGLAPALSAALTKINEPLKEGSRGSSGGSGRRLRNILVASEVALAIVVLCGAGLLIESMARVLRVRSGVEARNVLTMGMSLPQINLYYGPPVHPRFCQDLAERVGAIPGVIGVSSIAHLPLGGGGAGRGFFVEGKPDPGAEQQAGARYSVACPGYFRTMGIPMLEGREFTDRDIDGALPVIVINQAMARKYWNKEDPIGRRIKLGLVNSQEPWFTVVGVSADVRQESLDSQISPAFVRPYPQAAWPSMTIVVRTASSPGAFVEPVKKAIAEIDPGQPVSSATTMEEVLHDSVGPRRFAMLLLSAFAGLALLLAAVGISGVVSYAVAQRTHEIGIRVALGAGKMDVLRLVVTHSMLWAGAGTVAGIAGALGVMRLLSGMLYEVRPADPLVLASVSALLMDVALLSCYIPARRAAKVDPTTALRYQ
jgi:putative ABC transport system permease protein